MIPRATVPVIPYSEKYAKRVAKPSEGSAGYKPVTNAVPRKPTTADTATNADSFGDLRSCADAVGFFFDVGMELG
jgi:hypothetical protein